jgi:hypothetical protein
VVLIVTAGCDYACHIRLTKKESVCVNIKTNETIGGQKGKNVRLYERTEATVADV